MEVLLTVLIVLISVLLIGAVLIQNPKGGGMSSTIAGGNQMFGVKKTTDILEKGTWYLVIALAAFTIFLNANMMPNQVSTKSKLEESSSDFSAPKISDPMQEMDQEEEGE